MINKPWTALVGDAGEAPNIIGVRYFLKNYDFSNKILVKLHFFPENLFALRQKLVVFDDIYFLRKS